MQRGAATALRLIDDPVKLLSTTQVGITVVSIIAGAYGGATLADPLADYVRTIPVLAPYAHTLAFGSVVVAVAYVTLVIGELVPKRLALNHPEAIAAGVAPFMNLLAKFGAPIVGFLRVSTQAVLALFRIRPAADTAVTEEEVKALIAEGASVGVFQVAEQEMIEGVLRIGDRAVRTIMVPRPAVDWLDANDPPAELFCQIAETGHSRYPVARGDIEEVIGVAHTKDLLEQQRDHGHHRRRCRRARGAFRRRPDAGAPPARALPQLDGAHGHRRRRARYLRGHRHPDRHSDRDRGDLPESEEEGEPEAVQREDGTWLLDGMMSVDDVERTLALKDMGEDGDFNTIAGFVLHQLGRIPVAGEHFQWKGWRFEVVDLDGRRIDKILAAPPPEEPAAEA